jgi:hypothetical protein
MPAWLRAASARTGLGAITSTLSLP